MAAPFTGNDALHISDTVKGIMRGFLREKLDSDPYVLPSFIQGVDVVKADELIEGEVPQGRPLVSIRTRRKTRTNWKANVDGALRKGWSHRIELEVRVLADTESGAIAPRSSSGNRLDSLGVTTNILTLGADSIISDYVDDITGNSALVAELDALGVEIIDASERLEKGPETNAAKGLDDLHTNTHVIVCVARTLEE